VTGLLSTLDRADRLTIGLLGLFLATLAVVVALDEAIAWLLWGVATVVIVGTTLVVCNRSTPVEKASNESD